MANEAEMNSGLARGVQWSAAVGVPPQTPRRLGRKNVIGAQAPRPLLYRFWGGGPMGFGAEPQRGSGGGVFLAVKPPRGLGRAPTPCIYDSIKPTGLVRHVEPNLLMAGGL